MAEETSPNPGDTLLRISELRTRQKLPTGVLAFDVNAREQHAIRASGIDFRLLPRNRGSVAAQADRGAVGSQRRNLERGPEIEHLGLISAIAILVCFEEVLTNNLCHQREVIRQLSLPPLFVAGEHAGLFNKGIMPCGIA